jgi:integrase/recombinase XerC/integrase/recombinase XerD
MASLRKKGKVWYVRVRDESGRQREVKAGPDKSVAAQIKRDLESRNAKIKAGTLDPREATSLDAERIPIGQHVQDYIRFLAANGCVPDHFGAVSRRLEWLIEETGVSRLSQLTPSLVVEALSKLKAIGKADRTVFHYTSVIKAFTAWLKKNRRTAFDLLEELDRPAVITEAERPALSPEQTATLIATTRTSKARRGMSGVDRSWLYTLAVCTGLRRLELQALRPESFDLNPNALTVSLPPPRTKNRKGAVQPLPSYSVPDLRDWLATKRPNTPLFPADRNSSMMIKADLKAAGIPSDDYCFHSLRHTYISGVVQSGASVKVCMELARHSKPDLTFRRYSHSQAEDRSKAVNEMPILWEKCGEGDGLSIDLKPKPGMQDTIHQESLASGLPALDLWENCGKPNSSHTLPTSGVFSGPDGTMLNPQKSRPERSQVDPSRHVFQSG